MAWGEIKKSALLRQDVLTKMDISVGLRVCVATRGIFKGMRTCSLNIFSKF